MARRRHQPQARGEREEGEEQPFSSGQGFDEGEEEPLLEEEEEEYDLGEEEEEERESVTVEISGLSLDTHHGVTEAERQVAPPLVLPRLLDLGRCAATATHA